MTKLTLGIDATNLRQGGGRTHLIEVLRSAVPQAHGFGRVVVWGSESSLNLLEDQPWLCKCNPITRDSALYRLIWQSFGLARAARAEACDVLWVPGGFYIGNFQLVVTMSRNLLPFEWRELKRYGISWTALRLLLLRWAQARTFRRAQGVIFLTKYAEYLVKSVTGQLFGQTAVIAHGVSSCFRIKPKSRHGIKTYSNERPYRILYVSIVDQYKHTWNVVNAVASLRRKTGWPLILDLVGQAYPPALVRLKQVISTCDVFGEWVTYHGDVVYSELHAHYEGADLGVFASSCENMPNILLEMMSMGLPVASSNRGPMPEILGKAGVYFDPEKPEEIAAALEQMISDPDLCVNLADSSYSLAQDYSWEKCAGETFEFIRNVHQAWTHKLKSCAA